MLHLGGQGLSFSPCSLGIHPCQALLFTFLMGAETHKISKEDNKQETRVKSSSTQKRHGRLHWGDTGRGLSLSCLMKAFSPACAHACSVGSDSLRHHGLWPTRLLCPWDFPDKNTGVGCHFLLQGSSRSRDQSCISCTGRKILYHWAIWQACIFSREKSKCEDPEVRTRLDTFVLVQDKQWKAVWWRQCEQGRDESEVKKKTKLENPSPFTYTEIINILSELAKVQHTKNNLGGEAGTFKWHWWECWLDSQSFLNIIWPSNSSFKIQFLRTD